MSILKKTIKPFNYASLGNKDLPILSSAYISGHSDVYGTLHNHDRAQLIHPDSGLVKVKTVDGIWLISPSQAAWIPPGQKHQLLYLKKTSVKFLFIDKHYSKLLNKRCCVYDINSFVHELIKKSVSIGSQYEVGSHEFRINRVLIEEISNLTPSSLNLPLAKDKRILRVMNFLIEHPSSDKEIDYFSKIAFTSSRNLNRLFQKETKLTFGKWRKLLIALVSIERLSSGISVTEVSLDMGYNSLSSFINMFRKITGKTPGFFLK